MQGKVRLDKKLNLSRYKFKEGERLKEGKDKLKSEQNGIHLDIVVQSGQ